VVYGVSKVHLIERNSEPGLVPDLGSFISKIASGHFYSNPLLLCAHHLQAAGIFGQLIAAILAGATCIILNALLKFHPREPPDSPLCQILHEHYEDLKCRYDEHCEKEYGFFRPVVIEVVEEPSIFLAGFGGKAREQDGSSGRCEWSNWRHLYDAQG